MKTYILTGFFVAVVGLSASAQSAKSPPVSAKWLAGTWAGKANLVVRQTTDGRTTQQTARFDFKFEFDEMGRPMMDLERNSKTTLTHVNQVKKVLSGKSVTTYSVRALDLSEKGCLLKLNASTDRFTRTNDSSESFTSSAMNDWSFIKEGDGLRIKLVIKSTSKTAIRVLGTTSSSTGEGETLIEGLLKK